MQTIRALRGRGTAFSLVELLVVISIIGVLAALLLPALGAAVQHAYNVECQSNLKQTASAVLNYATDNRGSIPPTKYGSLYWCNLLVRGEYISADNTAHLTSSEESPGRSVLRCPLSYYVSASSGSGSIVLSESDIIQYPARFDGQPDVAQGTARLGDANSKVDCSYYWNGYAGNSNGEPEGGLNPWTARFPSCVVNPAATLANKAQVLHDISEIRQRTVTAMVMDGVYFDARTMNNRGRIAARHTGDAGARSSTNIAFYDGHVEAMPRAPGEAKDYKADTIQSANDLELTGMPIFLLPKR